MKLEKYNQNLKVELKSIFSYNTLVAQIDFEKEVMIPNGKYSQTTKKHINYVASVLNFKVQK